jgi:hypothetical protein
MIHMPRPSYTFREDYADMSGTSRRCVRTGSAFLDLRAEICPGLAPPRSMTGILQVGRQPPSFVMTI